MNKTHPPQPTFPPHLTAAEQEKNDDYEWALHDPEVRRRCAGKIAVVHRKQVLGAGKFARAERVVAALVAELRERGFDRVSFSGGATALGFEEEEARAADLLGVGRPGARAFVEGERFELDLP
jgi:hypothetical protein